MPIKPGPKRKNEDGTPDQRQRVREEKQKEYPVDRQGVISIVKKSMGAASGILKGIKAEAGVDENDSLRSEIQ